MDLFSQFSIVTSYRTHDQFKINSTAHLGNEGQKNNSKQTEFKESLYVVKITYLLNLGVLK